MSEFGEGFRKARKALGISLDEIAAETRIGTRFLQAIESEEFHRLPGGVFNRGFIRTFAERVGLDADAALSDYDRLVSPKESDVVQGDARPQHARFDRALYPIAVGTLVLLIILFYALNRTPDGGEVNTLPQDPPAQVSTSPPIVAAEPIVAAAPEPLVSPSTAPAPPAPVQLQLVVEMTASEAAWIHVVADGSLAGEEILQPGTTRRFSAQTSLDLTVGNAGGVALRINDKQVRSLGRPGEVRTLTITPANVNDIDTIIQNR